MKISTIEPIDGAKFTGMLAAVKGDFIELRMEDGQNIEVAFDNINKAHLRLPRRIRGLRKGGDWD